MTFIKTQKFDRKHRAVAPVIATILLVAIAVVGGTLIFSFSQGFFSEQQLSTPSALDVLVFNGYDARDINNRDYHTGATETLTDMGTATQGGGTFISGDTIFVYLSNTGSNTIDIVTVTFVGNTFTFDTAGTTISNTIPAASKYVITTTGTTTSTGAQVLEPGDEVTMVLSLSETIKVGRTALLQITTGTGEFSENITIGRAE